MRPLAQPHKEKFMKASVLILVLSLASFAQAANKAKPEGSTPTAITLKSQPASGQVVFEAVGKPSFLKIKGQGEGPAGEVQLAPQVQGNFKFKMDTLKTGIDLRDQHMKEKYLQVAQHPTAELKIEEVQNFDPAKESQSLPFKGQLTIHGVQKPVAGTVDIAKSDKSYKVKAAFETKISDYAIDIPSYSGIIVADAVKVSVETKLD